MPVLEALDIEKHFGGVIALDKAELICPPQKIVGLIGANGSGKSTISRIINGTYQPDSGRIFYQGKEIRFQSPGDAVRAGISMVYQNLSLVPDLTVWENINLGREPLSRMRFLDNKRARVLARQYCEKLCPWIDIEQKIRNLLPSEQQLIEIVKNLARQPKFLILDEPTAALEKSHVDMLFKLMRALKEEGVSIIFISHRLREVKEICDYLFIFRNGKTVGMIDFEKEEKDDEKIVSLITGEAYRIQSSIKHKRTFTKTALEIMDLTVTPKLNGISFEVSAGEIVGISGLHGQGQEELMLTLAGYIPIQTGKVKLDGNLLKLRHPKDAIGAGMVLVPGDRKREGLFMNHTIFMNLIYCQCGLKQTPWILKLRELKKISKQLCDSLTIRTPSIHKLANELSGGNQQKVVVANWLPLNPKILLLSDPAKGVDVQAKSDLYDLILGLAEQGTAILLYASDNEELIKVCDRILVLHEGFVLEDVVNEDIDEKYLVNAAMRAVTNQ